MIERVSKNVSPHNFWHNWSLFWVWLSFKNIITWWFSGKSKCSEGVHDKINPKHLNSVQWRVLDDDRSKENNKHSSKVNSQLELQEFSHIIENISTMSKSSDDGGEVIIKKNNITCTFGNISSSYSHSKTYISFGQSWSIVGTITSYSNYTIWILDTNNENSLIFWRRSS